MPLGLKPESKKMHSQVIAPNHQIYALKRIRLHGRDSESATGFVDEIRMLHKLRKKDNIIQLIDAEARASSSSTLLLPCLVA
jgi:serine/threonine-protein kinase TTK/MPS1